MLKDALGWPVSCGVAPGGVAKVVVTADCRSCRHPVGLPRDTCSLSIAQSICCHIWKNWWIVSAVNASNGMVGPVSWNGPGGSVFTLVMRESGPSVAVGAGPPGADRDWGCGGRAGGPPRAGGGKGGGGGRRQAADVGRWRGRIERLVGRLGADEELAEVRRRHQLELVALGEVRARRAVGLDDALRQQVQRLLVPAGRHVGGEDMIEAAVLADDDDDVLDRARRLARPLVGVVIGGGDAERCDDGNAGGECREQPIGAL